MDLHGGRNLRIRDICMEFGQPLTGHSLVTGWTVILTEFLEDSASGIR